MICAIPVSLIFTSLLREKGWCRGMTEKEAIARIQDHIEVHALHEEWAVYITQALNMAIKALEEIQQYREIGTVEKCQEAVEKHIQREY